MRQFTITKRFFYSILIFTAMAFVVSSCETAEDPIEAKASTEAPEIQASVSGYGSCGSCPLPSTISGTLPAQLYPSSSWMVNLSNCFEEDISDANGKCRYRTGTNSTVTENITVYLQFSTSSSNSLQSFCSYFYQVGNALEYNRPNGNWLLDSVNYMSHLTGSYYKINVTWRGYICQYSQVPAVK